MVGMGTAPQMTKAQKKVAGYKAIRVTALRYLGGACVCLLSTAPVCAQQNISPPPPFYVNAPERIIEPLPTPQSPVHSAGEKRGSDSDGSRLRRDLEAASRRVQSDGIRNQIQIRDATMATDRVRTEWLRAVIGDTLESARLGLEYDQRLAEYERWRDDKERQRKDLEPPPALDRDR